MSGGDLIHRGPGAAALPPISCLAFTRAPRPGVLRGWCDLHLPRFRLRLLGCPAFVSAEGFASIGLPSREIGKGRFAAMAAWDSRSIANAFSEAAVVALDRYEPHWRGRP